MTIQEAIKYLKQLYPNGGHCWLDEQRIEAIDIAIIAIEFKEKVRAEIERRIEELQPCNTMENLRAHGAIAGYYQILSFIDSMQLEEIPPKFPIISPKKCMYTKDDFTDEDRKVLCDCCEEDCEYAQKEEPVSEELEEASKEWLRPQLDKSYAAYGETKQMELTHFDGYAMLDAIEFGANWQKEKEYTCYEEAFEDGAKWKVENLWKPANGDNLPEIDREVVVFTQNFPNDVEMMSVAIAHRPNPNGWDGKSVTTGKVEHYIPKTYDKGGWNIPDVKFWLDLDIPKIEED